MRGQLLWIISTTVDTLVPRFWWWYGCERRHRGKGGKERRRGQRWNSIPLHYRKRLPPTLVRKMWGRGVGGMGGFGTSSNPLCTSHSPYSRGRNFLALGPCRPPQFLFTMLSIVSRLRSQNSESLLEGRSLNNLNAVGDVCSIEFLHII